MSPQLQKTIYGYSISGWRTNLREGGFRPFVFLEHGLYLAIFLAYTFLATLAYMRTQPAVRRFRLIGAAVWLFVTLVLVKSLGALIIAVLLAPVILLFGVRMHLLAAALIAGLILTYPALRGANLVPTEQIITLAQKIDTARASSLAFRFRNEDLLLEKANQKPLYGWGGWGRSRVFDAKGRNVSITDGRWVIVIGLGGWARYIAEFGLLTLPIILLAFRRRAYEITLATSGLCLVLTANLIDLIPNATVSPITWLVAGALVGRLELQRIEARNAQPVLAVAPASRYSRSPAKPRPSEPPAPDPVPSSAATPAATPASASPRRLVYTRQKRPRPDRQRS
jgi:hypothetical protein